MKPKRTPAGAPNARSSLAAPRPASIDRPTDDEIRRRAFEIYTRRKGGGIAGGSPELDWLQAERELMAERDSKHARR